jgi:hypothetical protein
MHTIFWLENVRRRDHLEDLGVDGRIILEWILGNGMGNCRLDLSGLGLGPVTCSCEPGNELSVSIKGRKFCD